jgi:hypothetical protein
MLTDAKIKKFPTPDKPVKLADSGGLVLWISNTGSKIWRLRYRLDGAEQVAVLGKYPEVTLAEARKLREDFKAQLREAPKTRSSRTKPKQGPGMAKGKAAARRKSQKVTYALPATTAEARSLTIKRAKGVKVSDLQHPKNLPADSFEQLDHLSNDQ